jgi:5S rRNA maturation endonuclease (ribonuclease M5)
MVGDFCWVPIEIFRLTFLKLRPRRKSCWETMEPKEAQEVEELLDELREDAEEGTPILVEGSRDTKALRELGVRGLIFKISNRKTALNSISDLANFSKIIIMTDFDRTGDELAKFCAKHLQSLGPRPILDIRKKLKELLRKEVKDSLALLKRHPGDERVEDALARNNIEQLCEAYYYAGEKCLDGRRSGS